MNEITFWLTTWIGCGIVALGFGIYLIWSDRKIIEEEIKKNERSEKDK